VLLALQKLFFWFALAFLQPRQSAKYHSNSSIERKSSNYSYHLAQAPVKLDS
jgi:hypothetical protein